MKYNMKILFWQWHSFMNRGIEAALQRMGIDYDVFFYQMADWEKDDRFEEELGKKLKDSSYTAVFSVNYNPLITKVCSRKDVLYISWIYDSPVHINNLEPMKAACNKIFCFDRGQVMEYQKAGIPVSHLPLAADPSVFKGALREKLKEGTPDNQMEVSLVGQLYQTEYADYCVPLNQYLKGYLEGIIHAQEKVYGGYFLKELVTEELLEKMNSIYDKASGGKLQINARQLEYLMAREVTGRERFLALALLSNHFDTTLFSANKNEALDKVKQPGYIDYYTGMPRVFSSSRVNLNISLKTIRTGIPLRVLDILACGGFVITNYQEELLEYFTLGEDIVIYESIEDLYQKTAFFLQNDTERKRIAANGMKCIDKYFRFEDRVKTMFEL